MSDVAITMSLSGFDGVKTAFGGVKTEAEKMAAGVDKASASTQTFGQKLTSLKGVITGLGLGVAVKYIADLEDGMEQTARAASRLGVSFSGLQSLEMTAKRFGAGVGEATTALKFFNRQIGEASIQPMGTSSRLFKALGVDITDATGQIKNSEQLFRETLDGIARLGSGAEQTKAIFALFGEQSGNLVDLFRGGTSTLDEFRKHLESIGAVVGDHVAPNLRDANSIVYDFQDALEGVVKKTIAGALLAFEDLGTAAGKLFEDLDFQKGLLGDDWEQLGIERGSDMLAGFNKLGRMAQTPRSIKGALDPRADNDARRAAAQAIRDAEKLEEDFRRLGITTRGVTRDMHESWVKQQDDLQDLATSLFADAITPMEEYANKLLLVEKAASKLGASGVARVVDNLNKELAESNRTFRAFENAADRLFDGALQDGHDFADLIEDIGKQLGMDILRANVLDPLKDAAKGLVGGMIGGGGGQDQAGAMQNVFTGFLENLGEMFSGDKGLIGGLQELFFGDKGLLGGLSEIFSSAWEGLSAIFSWLIGEQNAIALFETAERWAVAIWETAERWAIAIFEAAAGFFGFERGGEMTVTRPTLIMVGEKNKAERVRVSPISGGLGRGSSPGFGGSPSGGGGGPAVNVYLPQTSVINNITTGTFARTMARAVRNETARRV